MQGSRSTLLQTLLLRASAPSSWEWWPYETVAISSCPPAFCKTDSHGLRGEAPAEVVSRQDCISGVASRIPGSGSRGAILPSLGGPPGRRQNLSEDAWASHLSVNPISPVGAPTADSLGRDRPAPQAETRQVLTGQPLGRPPAQPETKKSVETKGRSPQARRSSGTRGAGFSSTFGNKVQNKKQIRLPEGKAKPSPCSEHTVSRLQALEWRNHQFQNHHAPNPGSREMVSFLPHGET